MPHTSQSIKAMSISELALKFKKDLQSVNDKIESIKNTTAIDVINDENFKLPSKSNDNDDLSKLSISQLNDKLNKSDETLAQLNKLWIIKGLIQEVKTSLNPIDEANYTCDKYELQSICNNLSKLKQKLSQFDNSLIIFDGLNDSYQELVSSAHKQFQLSFKIFFPESNTFARTIVTNEIEMTYEEFVSICSQSEEVEPSISIKPLFHKLQLDWDKILDKILNEDKKLILENSNSTFTLNVVDVKIGFNQYCESVAEFMNFINLFNNQSFKNFYLSKISNSLTNQISKNINSLINPSNKSLIENLFNTIKLSKNSHWLLSIEKSLTSETDINNKLNDLYFDWVVDNYINRLRNVYINEFPSLSNDLHDEHYTLDKSIDNKGHHQDQSKLRNDVTEEVNDEWDVDAWDDAWDDDETPQISSLPKHTSKKESNWDEDAWDQDAWEDEENNVEKEQEKKDIYKASKLPSKLTEILSSFQKETKSNDLQPLISAIESFSIVSYPSLKESFLLYNDLHTLNKTFKIGQLKRFLDINFKQTTQSMSNEVLLIMLSINLKHDDIISEEVDLENFKLDNENESKLKLIDNWFIKMNNSDLKTTNNHSYKEIILDIISLILNWLNNSIISMNEITEYQSAKLSNIINRIKRIIDTNLILIDESNASVAAYNKLTNVSFLINNHLKDIMERFYQGEFFDLSTNELVSVIESIFVKSELRDNYIGEILDIRNVEA